MFYQLGRILVLGPIMKYWFKVRLTGVENIHAGGVIIAANHIDAGDTFSLPGLLRRRMVFAAKKELFTMTGIVGKLLRWVLLASGQAPLDRSGGQISKTGLGPLEAHLANGGLCGIFPEGTRSPSGHMYKGHTGVARLALANKVPVVPVAMHNTFLVKSRIGLPTMRDAWIEIGKPVYYRDYYGKYQDYDVIRWVTNDIMAQIQRMSGQEYLDVYAQAVKKAEITQDQALVYAKATPTTGMVQP